MDFKPARRLSKEDPPAVIAAFGSIARPIMRKFMNTTSCISAARTTIETMRIYGLRAVELPVCFVFQVLVRKYARIIGIRGEELAEIKAKSASWEHVSSKRAGWDGHLIVLVENRWLIDAAIDQADSPRFGVRLPPEVFVADLAGQDWNPNENFEINLGLILDNGDKATLIYRNISDRSYLESEAWKDEGLPLLAHVIAIDMEMWLRPQRAERQ
jgi:hypothetical protein